ncbi:MAG: hypothetical protein F4Y57_09540, partial [Acidobacteria bacterium]|nr:hypothetical protein [Acidobacteriota bacterium]
VRIGTSGTARHTVSATDDGMDEPRGSVTVTLETGAGYGFGTANSATVAVRDDDPTVVSLRRTGSGPVREGGKAAFTVTLGRALAAGETIVAPLSVSGTGVTTADWRLTSISGTGVSLLDSFAAAPKVRFSGAGAQTATLELTALRDGTPEASETLTVALGTDRAFDAPDLGTNVGGGADPHGTDRSFDLTVSAEPHGLVFDKTNVHWNESDGCTDLPQNNWRARRDLIAMNAPGPSYRVRLASPPTDIVDIDILDPQDRFAWGNRNGTLYRVFAGNGYRGIGTKEPRPDLRFTPQNWDRWQTVRTRVVCGDHSREAVPLIHRFNQPSGRTRAYYGRYGETWTVHVHVKDSKPPIEVLDLPAPWTQISLAEGAHRDFRIRISDEILPDGSNKRLAVDVAAWGRGRPVSVGRRDGTARPCGTLSDCMVFTPSSREQWVRLRGDSDGDSTLFIRALGLRGWGDSYSWEMRWPVKVRGVCSRTRPVRDAIVRKVPGVSHCSGVTPAHLEAITGKLDFLGVGISSLQADDFDGLTGLTELNLNRNSLTELPTGIFDDLTALRILRLLSDNLTAGPAGIFDELAELEDLYLNLNRLSTLPAGIFDRNTKLTWLGLNNNRFASLPEGVFARLQDFGGRYFGQFLANNPGAPFSPTTNAGADQPVSTGAEVTLSGTATGPWGENVLWEWTQVDGPASTTAITGGVTLTGADSAMASFTAPATPATLHFRLTATPHTLVHPSTRNRRLGIARGHDWVTVIVGAGSGAPPVQVPETAVSGLQITAVDDTSASVTWDAVDRATSYAVLWEALPDDPQGSAVADGESVTGTSATIQHDATEPMTLTVTVAPEYIDGNGDIQRLDGLAATATLAVGPGAGDGTGIADSVGADTEAARAAAVAACVSDDLKATTERYYDLNSGKAPKYGRNWFRVMVAFGMRTPGQWARGGDAAPYTAAEARTSQGVWNGWKPFAKALECIETEMASQPEQAQEPETPPGPEVTVSG